MLRQETAIGWLRWTGYAEGASFLVLLGVAMPLKYFAGQPGAVHVVGMAHGILFLVYGGLAILVPRSLGWPIRVSGLLLAAALVPFGPFWADCRLLQPRQAGVSS